MYYEIKTKSSTFFYTTQKKYMQKLLKPSQNSSSDCIGFSGYIHFAAKSPEIIIHMTYQSMSSLLISCQRSFLFAGSQWHTCDQKLYCTTHLYDPLCLSYRHRSLYTSECQCFLSGAHTKRHVPGSQ